MEVGEECDCGARAVSLFNFTKSGLFVVVLFVQMDEALPVYFLRSATRTAARSVLSPTGRTAVTARAAITHVWYEFGLFSFFFTAQHVYTVFIYRIILFNYSSITEIISISTSLMLLQSYYIQLTCMSLGILE